MFSDPAIFDAEHIEPSAGIALGFVLRFWLRTDKGQQVRC
jgi:hypothetical protein